MQIAEVQGNACTVAPSLEMYEAPRIELVLSAEAVEREVHYAGTIISCPGPNCPPS